MKLRSLILCLATLSAAPLSEAEESLSGTYVLFQETTSITEMPVVSNVVARTRSVSIQKLQQDGGRLRGSGKLCNVHIKSSSNLVHTELPRAFQDALPPVVTDATLSGSGKHKTFNQAPQTLVVGAKLKDKKKESLPASAKDARVRDSDGDGQPGVTVRVTGIVSGEVYLVQRSTSSLDGRSYPGGFKGKVRFSNEQKILGASSSMLERDPGGEPDLSRSHFRLHRVSDDVTCAEAQRMARSW